DNKVFIYCEKQVYETRQKLYELEEALKEKHFLRVSKSVLLNLMKIESIKSSLNGRFMAVIQNEEQIIVSRKYVPELKKALKGGNL
ncbi:MAG: LytTR family transcriptional regulator DNA-binding domain-containing protein, partial [Clostridium sp.]|nr:LytTR family transcriptional regulator DNA-binding domain-containing protein [Clostridium sp.]